VTGLLVPEKDADALAGAIASVIEDPALGARLGRAARLLVEERFGWDRHVDRLEQAYDRAARAAAS
jgi:glycosyltransferase involved in cell wall biosynthesis